MPVPVLILGSIRPDLSFLDEFGDQIEILDANGEGADLDALLGRAEVALMAVIPTVVAARAPNLRWAHHPYAGVSNFFRSDLWTSDVVLTSTRGSVGPTAIAEYAMAGLFYFSRGIDIAVEQKQEGRFATDGYAAMRLLQGATVGVVGLGGIGREVARLAVGVGMRVVATRRSVTEPQLDVDGVDVVLPADALHKLLGESDYVVVCSQFTEETRDLFDAAAFAAMKPGAIFVNVARGEEVDEEALVAALHSGHLRGALLDVHAGEAGRRPPSPELLDAPNLVLTPHISTGGDPDLGAGGRRVFAENLRRYLRGEPLQNVADRTRGY